jgi:hypothetical protein
LCGVESLGESFSLLKSITPIEKMVKGVDSSIVGRSASDEAERAKLVLKVWDMLEETRQMAPFVTLEAEFQGKKRVVQLATHPRGMICNLSELDEKTFERANRFVEEKVGSKNILSAESNFVTFLVRRDEVTGLLESYFTQVLGMPKGFRLTVTEFVT